MGERKRKTARFLLDHPYCCFCGGRNPATTVDHQPGRVFFKDRAWPEGFAFSACDLCNAISRQSEKVMSLLIHGDAETDGPGRFVETVASINREYPSLLDSMLPSNREIRNFVKDKGIVKPRALSYEDIPLIKLNYDFWRPHFEMFATKILLSLHYQCFAKILPMTGAV